MNSIKKLVKLLPRDNFDIRENYQNYQGFHDKTAFYVIPIMFPGLQLFVVGVFQIFTPVWTDFIVWRLE